MPKLEKVLKGLASCGTKEHCHFGEDGCPYYFPECPDDCTSRLARQARELLKARQWISVKDRLPETYKSVITYDKYSGVKENWLLAAKPCVSWSTGFHVTHWMPLPEPPKEDDQ